MTLRAAARSPGLLRVLGMALGALFVYASLDKIARPAEFARIVYHYHLIGPSQHLRPVVANTFAVALPWVEAVAGTLLVFGVWRREAALVTAVLLLSFLGAVSLARHRGIDIENCGCFTVSGKGRQAGLGLLAGDAALFAVALLVATGAEGLRRHPEPH